MTTSYDDIYKYFINNIQIRNSFLPQGVDEQKEAIGNAVDLYNNRMRTELTYDADDELVTGDLDSDGLLLLGNYIKLVILRNIHTFKSSLLRPYSKEIGSKDVQAQLKAAQYDVQQQEQIIDDLVFFSDEEDIMS